MAAGRKHSKRIDIRLDTVMPRVYESHDIMAPTMWRCARYPEGKMSLLPPQCDVYMLMELGFVIPLA